MTLVVMTDPPLSAGDEHHTSVVRFSPVPDAARMAREQVTAFCAARGLADLADTATLLTSELVTNAIRHGTGEITLILTHFGTQLMVQVSDYSPDPPLLAEPAPGPEETHGRGLHLVDQLADSWNYTTHPGDGKIVHFTLTTPSAPQPDGARDQDL